MREFKFRAWGVMFRYEQPKMVYYPSWSTLHCGEVLVFEKEHTYVDESDYNNDLVLMQYTGLKDKNGKEIYEGDYIEDENGDIAVVYFADGVAQFRLEYKSIDHWEDMVDMDGTEIIGNIYENPELLEAK